MTKKSAREILEVAVLLLVFVPMAATERTLRAVYRWWVQ